MPWEGNPYKYAGKMNVDEKSPFTLTKWSRKHPVLTTQEATRADAKQGSDMHSEYPAKKRKGK